MEVPSNWTCLICGHSQDNVAYVTPCFHQLCYGCALWWAKKTRCAICGHKIRTVQHSVRSDDDCHEYPVPRPTAHSDNGLQDAQGPAEPVFIPTKHNFPPELWAAFFRKHPGDIGPLLRWLKQEISRISSDGWWDVHAKQSIILGFLCKYGLDEATLLQKVQPSLRGFTARFVRRLIIIAVALYGPEIRQQQDHQDTCAAGGQEDSPAAASHQEPPDSGPGHSTSPASPSAEELPGIFSGGSGHPTTTPTSSEEPQKEPGHAAGVGSSTQRRDCLSGGSRSPLKRKASSSPQGLPPPCKRQPWQQH